MTTEMEYSNLPSQPIGQNTANEKELDINKLLKLRT